jgi:hypothetical protein
MKVKAFLFLFFGLFLALLVKANFVFGASFNCAQFIYPNSAPVGTICKIGSGQRLFTGSDVEVGQSENGPWLLCSGCGQPHDSFGFEGPIWIRASWGVSFSKEKSQLPAVSAQEIGEKIVIGPSKSSVSSGESWRQFFWPGAILFLGAALLFSLFNDFKPGKLFKKIPRLLNF